MRKHRQQNPEQRGYVLMVVLILMVVLTSAGIYGLRTVDGDMRASASVKRTDTAAYAAEAGASQRMAELMMATEDAGAGLTSAIEGIWFRYPGAAAGNNAIAASYQVVAEPVVAVEANPPPGVQIGSGGQITMWRIDAFAVSGAGLPGPSAATSNSQRVSVGLSMWSRGGLSYNVN